MPRFLVEISQTASYRKWVDAADNQSARNIAHEQFHNDLSQPNGSFKFYSGETTGIRVVRQDMAPSKEP